MAKVVLNNQGQLTPSTNTAINTNWDAIEVAMEKTLSRDGTSPNEMEADLDMNSNQIYNLPVPADLSSAARWQDVVNLQLASTLTGINGFLYLNLATSIPSTTIAANVEGIYVGGYALNGVGACFWRKVPSLPTHTAYHQSANGYYFVPDVQQLDYTMSPAQTGDAVITAAIALGCGFRLMFAQSGNVTLGPVGSGANFNTVATMKLFLTKSNVEMGATLNIKVVGHHAEASSNAIFDFDHPDGMRINITCGDDHTVIVGRVIQSSGHSVTGTSGNYTAVFHLDSVANISIGDFARVQYVKDNRRIEWCNYGNALGVLSRNSAGSFHTSRANVLTWTEDVFLNPLAVDDLILWKGETRRVTAITDASNFTCTGDFSGGNPASNNGGSYWYRLGGGYGTSNVCTSPSPGTHSTTLNFTDTSVLFKGSIVVADGQAGRIVSIDSPTAVTVHTLMDVPANTPFAIIGLSYCFEGAHEITAVDTNANTITCSIKAILPEDLFDFNADYIKGGRIDIVRAGIKNTTTGDIFNFRSGVPPKLIDNIYMFPGTAGYAIETGTTQTITMKKVGINLGIYATIVNGFGALFITDSDVKCNYLGGLTSPTTIAPMISGLGSTSAVGAAHVIQHNAGNLFIRGIKITGCKSTYGYSGSNGAGIYNSQSYIIAGCNSGSYVSANCGILGDDQRLYFVGYHSGSGSEEGTLMAFRSIGSSAHDVQMNVIGCNGDGLTYNVGAAARVAGGLIIAQNGYGLTNNDSAIEINGINILGSGTVNYSSTLAGSAEAENSAFTNSGSNNVQLLGRSTMIGPRMILRRGGVVNLEINAPSYFYSPSAYIMGGNVYDINPQGRGAEVYIPSTVATPVLHSNFTFDYIDNGSIVRTTDIIYYPQVLFAELALDFGVINSDAREVQTITVSGARVGDTVIVHPISATYIADTATRVTVRGWVSATDTVSIEVMNNTATNSSNLTSQTFRAVVLRWT